MNLLRTTSLAALERAEKRRNRLIRIIIIFIIKRRCLVELSSTYKSPIRSKIVVQL